MCGIYGGSPSLIQNNAAELLRHRGPNQAGEIRIEAPDGRGLVFGETRLNVVCRQDVPTPMSRGAAHVAFNGEVYNWRALRRELEQRGHTFETPTDTEVVLAAYLEWGPACLERFNGMFAVAIWHDGRLFLARDRLGKKPLFFTRSQGELAFASELKAFARLEYDEVPICRSLEFYFDEHTPFANVVSVRPGQFLVWEPARDELSSTQYYELPQPGVDITDPDEAVTRFLDLFEDAVRLRKAADVPVTLFLSGGIDSALIQAVDPCEITYTVQFEEFRGRIDEEPFVLELGERLGFDARILVPTREQFLACFSELARAMEFPVGSFSVFPLFCLAQAARQDGFVVALSGEGSDELFNGYFRNELLLREHEQTVADLEGPYETLCRRYFGDPLDRFCRMASRRGSDGVAELRALFGPRWCEEHSFGQNLTRIETSIFLQPLLTMADRLSMRSSLEVRNPFLDHRIVELAARIDDAIKFRDGRGKWVVREALARRIGRDSPVVRRRVKHGLPAPVNWWLFKSRAFERSHYNELFLGECLKELARARQGSP